MNISVLKESQKLAHREARKGLTNCFVSNRTGWHCLGVCYCILVVSIQNPGAQQIGGPDIHNCVWVGYKLDTIFKSSIIL